MIATGSQIGAALFLPPFGIWAAPPSSPRLKAWGTAIALGMISTGIAYILYFRLIANVGAMSAIAVTFLIPVFGMLWGLLILSEPVTARMVVGTAIILAGTALTMRFIDFGQATGLSSPSQGSHK